MVKYGKAYVYPIVDRLLRLVITLRVIIVFSFLYFRFIAVKKQSKYSVFILTSRCQETRAR
jgi:hypothetical protein